MAPDWVIIVVLFALIFLVGTGLVGWGVRFIIDFIRRYFVLVFVVGVLNAQPVPKMSVGIVVWDSPDSVQLMRVWEYSFDDAVEFQDSLNLVYLKQSLWWSPDTAIWPLEQFRFDSVIGRGDGRKVLIRRPKDKVDTLWLDYSTRITPTWIPVYSRGNDKRWIWPIPGTNDQYEMVMRLSRVVGLDIFSRAHLRIFAVRKPRLTARWWND